MSAVAAGVAEVDERFDEMMSFCLQCRACEPVCPSVVPFGRAMEGARVEIAAQRPNKRRKLSAMLLGPRGLGSSRSVRFATILAALGQRMRLDLLPTRLTSPIAGLRRIPMRDGGHRGVAIAPAGSAVGEVALLIGCVQDQWFTGVNDAAISLLTEAGYRVTAPADQTCCGALAAHDGAAREAEALAAANGAAFEGCDAIVATAAGCSAHLRGYAEWAEGGAAVEAAATDVTVAVANAIAAGRLPMLPARNQAVAIQDPCHLRHAQRVVAEPRTIVRAAGYEPVEIDPEGMCCGAAGIYVLRQPVASDQLGKRKADQVRAVGATMVASANPGCEMQLRSNLGSGYDIKHPIEIYADALADYKAFS